MTADTPRAWNSTLPARRAPLPPGKGIAARRGGGNSGPAPEVRLLVLKRDGYRCVRCGRSVIGIRYSLGHRKRASQGGKPVPSNLLVFCGWGGEQCHGDVDSRCYPDDEARGYSLRSWQDPAAEPVMLFSENGSGMTAWLDDLGNYLTAPPGEVAA